MDLKKSLTVLLLAFGLSACANIFAGEANTNSDQALLQDATDSLDAQNYTQAMNDILTLQTNNTAYKTDPKALMLLASAYGGLCGFNFVNYFTTIKNNAPGATPLLQWLMNQWTSVTTTRAYCRLAENTVKLITPTWSGRDPNQSMFMVLLGLTKIGIYERELFDPGATGNATPQNANGGKPFCITNTFSAGGPTVNSDADIADIGVGLSLVVANLQNVGTALSGASFLTNVTAECTTLAGVIGSNPCLEEDETAYQANAQYIAAMRTLLDQSSGGAAIGLYNGATCP